MTTDIKTYGAKENANYFANFIAACQQKAIEIDCNILEVRIYGDYGWAQASFLVDRFGGVAAIINHFKGGNYTGSTGAKVDNFATIEEALAPVAEAYAAEEKARARVEMFNCD